MSQSQSDTAGSSQSQSQNVTEVTESAYLSRRGFLRVAGAGAGAAAVGTTGIKHGSQDAQAVPPVLVGAGYVVGASAFTWALTEIAVQTSEDVPEGYTEDALRESNYQTLRTRDSTNASTFFDNRNFMEGMTDVAYAESKISAIEALNEQLTQQEVQDAALETLNDYEETVLTNLFRTWNESVREFENVVNSVRDHPDFGLGTDIYVNETKDDIGTTATADQINFQPTTQYEFTNGNTIALETVNAVTESEGEAEMTLWGAGTSQSTNDYDGDWSLYPWFLINYGGNQFHHLDGSEWAELVTEIENLFDNVRDGMLIYIDTVYSDVQSGDIETADLITPRERAAMMSDDESLDNAIADLIALNQYVDPDREATITLLDDNVTLTGTFARTSNDGSLDAGEIYDPETLTGDVYFTYNVASGSGLWTDYEDPVDGGIVTFLEEPHDGVEYDIHTVQDETATVELSDFTHDDTDNVWTVDISEQLEDSITEVESVEFFTHPDDEHNYETVTLKQQFEIEKFVDSDGEEVQSAEFEQSQDPQTDNNYITQEEWDEMQERNEELIQKYEEAQGGGLFGGGGFLEGTNSRILVLVAAGLAAVGLLNN